MQQAIRTLEIHETRQSSLLDEPAPAAQLAYAARIGVSVPRGTTRRQLGQLIGRHIDEHEASWQD